MKRWAGLLALLPLKLLPAQSVGLNFASNRLNTSLGADQEAGVVVQANWNNLGPATGGPLTLNDSIGNPTPLQATWAFDEAWSATEVPMDGNVILLAGWFAAQNVPGTNTINITNIPYSNDDQVLYFNHDRGGETADVSKVNSAFQPSTVRESDTDILNPMIFVQQVLSNGNGSDQRGNFAIISDLKAPALNMIINTGTIGVDRLPLSGMQLVNRGSNEVVITDIQADKVNGRVGLTWTSQIGRWYSIDVSTGLTEDGWLEVVDEIEATGSSMTNLLTGINFGTNPVHFYRARIVQ